MSPVEYISGTNFPYYSVVIFRKNVFNANVLTCYEYEKYSE